LQARLAAEESHQAFRFVDNTFWTSLSWNTDSSRAEPQETQAGPQTRSSTEDLQKQTQNPVANLISVPFQSNTDFNAGPFARDKNTLNIQPVFAKPLGQSVILIPRIIIPIIFHPDLTQPSGRRLSGGENAYTCKACFVPGKVYRGKCG